MRSKSHILYDMRSKKVRPHLSRLRSLLVNDPRKYRNNVRSDRRVLLYIYDTDVAKVCCPFVHHIPFSVEIIDHT